jgi:hypothetical protein
MALLNRIKEQEATHYISEFENRFESYVECLALLIVQKDPASVKPCVQALINSYHELGKEISPINIPHFNTLMMFLKITGASLGRTNENESLNILKEAKKTKLDC